MKRQSAETLNVAHTKHTAMDLEQIQAKHPTRNTKTKWPSASVFFRISCTNYGSFEFLSEIRRIYTNAQAYVRATFLAGETAFPFFRHSVVAVRGAR